MESILNTTLPDLTVTVTHVGAHTAFPFTLHVSTQPVDGLVCVCVAAHTLPFTVRHMTLFSFFLNSSSAALWKDKSPFSLISPANFSSDSTSRSLTFPGIGLGRLER